MLDKKNIIIIALALIVAVTIGSIIIGSDDGVNVGSDINNSVSNDTIVVENGIIETNSSLNENIESAGIFDFKE